MGPDLSFEAQPSTKPMGAIGLSSQQIKTIYMVLVHHERLCSVIDESQKIGMRTEDAAENAILEQQEDHTGDAFQEGKNKQHLLSVNKRGTTILPNDNIKVRPFGDEHSRRQPLLTTAEGCNHMCAHKHTPLHMHKY